MKGFILRVMTYHGEPKYLGTVPSRPSVSVTTPVPDSDIVNDFDNEVVLDLNNQRAESSYTLDALIDDFQRDYKCKVNYENGGIRVGNSRLYSFDVFEPSWPSSTTAESIASDLKARLFEWVRGYPTGR